MSHKLFVTDLDGTLLDSPRGLSHKAVEKLNLLIDEGLNLLIATGRDMENTKKAVDGLKVKNLTVLTNGAILGNINSGEYNVVRTINPQISDGVMQIAAKHNLQPIVYAAYNSYKKIVEFRKGKWKNNEHILLTKNEYEDIIDWDVISIQFCERLNIIEPIHEEIKKKYGTEINLIKIQEVSMDGYYWLEINSIEAGKENMIDYYLKQNGMDWNSVIAFGDQANDLEFLKKASYSICPSTADPQIFEYVDEVVEEPEKISIIRSIEKIFRNL